VDPQLAKITEALFGAVDKNVPVRAARDSHHFATFTAGNQNLGIFTRDGAAQKEVGLTLKGHGYASWHRLAAHQETDSGIVGRTGEIDIDPNHACSSISCSVNPGALFRTLRRGDV